MVRLVTKVLCVCSVMFILVSGCKKFERKGNIQSAGIAITFDDNYIDNWITYLPLLDSVGAKVTFYICKYNRFTADQKNKLAIIQSHGHEIAYHTTNHYNMEDYVYKANHSVNDLLKTEIETGLKAMNKDGFYPTTFAYPYGAHNELFDKLLMRYFKSVRALNGTTDFSASLVTSLKNNLLYGLGIDKSSNRSDNDLERLMKSAEDNHSCAVFVAHEINTKSKFSITIERLRKVLIYAQKHNLKFYTINEISG